MQVKYGMRRNTSIVSYTRRGGAIRDSLMDIGLVAVGLTYQGPWWWPVMIVAAVAVGAVVVEAKRVQL